MSSTRETWLLPDGVADILPAQAHRLEHYRRVLLDSLFQRGYQLVLTPLVEFVESMLLEKNPDLDLLICKITDQYTGRQMGVRADITPQVARIDAHVNPSTHIARYCYASSVLHTRMGPHATSRTPLQLGAELFGHVGIHADLEIIETTLAALEQLGLTQGILIDIGHIGIFQALLQLANVPLDTANELQHSFERKALPELRALTQSLPLGNDFYHLALYSQHITLLQQHLSTEVRAHAPIASALQQLATVQSTLTAQYPHIAVTIDAAEMSNYHYHTGLVFSVYAPHSSTPIAKGGRYDNIGQAFGHARAATGFSIDLLQLINHPHCITHEQQHDTQLLRIAAPASTDPTLQSTIRTLRQAGHTVVQMLEGDSLTLFNAELYYAENTWHVKQRA